MAWLTRLSIDHRKIVAILSLAIIAVGIYLAPQLRQQLIPDLTFPSLSVSAQYPGADPEVVETQVTAPLESALGGLDGINSVTSTSAQGSATLRLSFDYGLDSDALAADVTAAIAGLSGLPETATTTVGAGFSTHSPTLTLAVSSTGDLGVLAEDLRSGLVPQLEAIDGVAEVTLTGSPGRTIAVTPNLDALATHGLTPAAITAALTGASGPYSAGAVTASGQSLSIGVGDALTSADDVAGLWLTGRTATGTESIRLDQVATVALQDAPQTTITRTDGVPSLGIALTATRDGSPASISDDAHDVLDAVTLPAGADLLVLSDDGPEVRESVVGLLEEGLIGLVMAILVILLFLRSVSSTLITAVSIPASLLVAVIALWAGDFSLNMLTLGGLAIAIGRVVDDSIVVLENIKRHLGYGGDRRTSIIAAVREVAGAVTASTLTTVAVFLPILLLGGIVGELFAPFAIAVGSAMLASLVIALTVVPTLAYWFLRTAPVPEGLSADEHRAEAESAERAGWLQRVYRPVIVWALRFRKSVLGGAAALLVGTVLLALTLPTSFLGATEQSTISVTQELPSGTDLASTDAAATRVEAAIAAVDGITSYQATVGSSTSPHTARFAVVLSGDADLAAVQAELEAALDGVHNAGELSVGVSGTVSGGGISVVLRGSDDAKIAAASEQIGDALANVPEVTEVNSGLATAAPSVSVTAIDGAAATLGFTDATLAAAVAQSVQGMTVATVTIDGAATRVVVMPASVPTSVAEIAALRLPTPTGGTAVLGDIATVAEVEAPAQLVRVDGQRSNTITATVTGENTNSQASAAVQSAIDDLDLPAGVSVALGGESASQSEAFSSLILAMVAAIVLVLLILLAVFGSFAQTAILLVSIPFAFTGALLLLLITNISLGVAAMIGLLMLIGIVVTNAVVLMDLINQYRKRGMSVHDAVIDGSLRRLRPILMTAIATIAALFPMALGITGSGGFLSTPLAVVVIGGLVTSTLLTLVLIPVLYSMVEERRERRMARRAERGAARTSA